MGEIFATCGHKISAEQMKSYWWETFDDEGWSLSCGFLCPDCVPIFKAVEAESYEQAQELLRERRKQ